MGSPRSRKQQLWETAPAQLDDLDEKALLDGLRKFVKNSRLDMRRIALLMGVSSATLEGWMGGTVQPRKAKLLDIKSFLGNHAPDCLLSKGEFRHRGTETRS
jgi:hypothetical protein